MMHLHNLRLYPQNFPDRISLDLTAYSIPILHRLRHFIFICGQAQVSVFGVVFGLSHIIRRLSVKDIAL